jgi:Uma2 family endonuclease
VNLKLDEPKTDTIEYPTSDGRPMAETDLHRTLMFDLITSLDDWFLPDPMVYVSGNLLVFYRRGNKRRHLAPDVFAVRGVPKRRRDHYLIWEEGKSPEVVIELTSASTRDEDIKYKFDLYQDELRVKEYFLFDPYEEYLDPSFQGFRLIDGEFQPIAPADGRLPSEVLGLHLFRDGTQLRLWDPKTGKVVATRSERAALAENRAVTAEERAATAEGRAATAEDRAATAEDRAKSASDENDRLRAELEQMKKRLRD